MQKKLKQAINLRTKRDFNNAEKIFLELLKIDRENCNVNYHYAWLQDLKGNEAIAIKHYLIAIDYNLKGDDLTDCMLGLGSSYRMIENYDKSIEVFERAIKLFPQNYELKLFLSFSYFDNENYKKAYALLLKTLIETNNNESITKYKNAINGYLNKI